MTDDRIGLARALNQASSDMLKATARLRIVADQLRDMARKVERPAKIEDLIAVFTREEAEGLANAIAAIARQHWPDEGEGEDVE